MPRPSERREDQEQPAKIEQRAGNWATQIGQVFGNVVIQLLTPVTTIIIIVAVAVAGTGAWYLDKVGQKPARMTGDFNIAVAQFGEVTDKGVVSSARALQMSDLLFNFLDSTYKTTDFGQNIQVAHKKIGILTEDREAEQLARDINANIVIYGNVFVDNNNATFSPKFYVRERNQNGTVITGEFTGQHQLAAPIQFDISLVDKQEQANNELQSRAATLVHFTQGMVYYSAQNPKAAAHSFEQALRASEQGGSQRGDEVLYFFLAEAERFNGDFFQAAKHADKALQLNPEYARAYILRGNIYYALFERTYNKIVLNKALISYKRALTAKYQPPGAYVTQKANVSLGNIYVTQAQDNNNKALFTQAIDLYSAVITEYEATKNESLREITAKAYFGLGAAYERQGNAAKAIESYQQCIKLSIDPDLKSRTTQQINLVTKGHT